MRSSSKLGGAHTARLPRAVRRRTACCVAGSRGGPERPHRRAGRRSRLIPPSPDARRYGPRRVSVAGHGNPTTTTPNTSGTTAPCLEIWLSLWRHAAQCGAGCIHEPGRASVWDGQTPPSARLHKPVADGAAKTMDWPARGRCKKGLGAWPRCLAAAGMAECKRDRPGWADILTPR
jgi:hypothetical protein